MVVIQISKLTKYYGKKKVLDELSVDIESGIFGFLGPNGAGKTTLMRCIVGLLEYEGDIYYKGEDLNNTKGLNIGYLPQNFSLFHNLTVKEALEYVFILKNAKGNQNEIIEKILVDVNLEKEKNKKIKNLSGGMLRRVGIAQALIGDPDLLIVDEPTAGLDPKERVRFRNLLQKLATDVDIIISSHIVEDIEILCDSIAFFNQGSIILKGDTGKLIDSMVGKVGTIKIRPQELASYESMYLCSVLSSTKDYVELKVVGDDLPKDTIFMQPELEDLYFYTIGELNE